MLSSLYLTFYFIFDTEVITFRTERSLVKSKTVLQAKQTHSLGICGRLRSSL